MSRIDTAGVDPSVAEDLRAYRLPDGRPMELFLALSCCPPALADLRRATSIALRDLDLPVRTRELVVLRTLARARAEAEWGLHVHLFAAAAGLAPAEVAATADVGASRWSAADARLLALADACHDRDGRLPDMLWGHLLEDGLSTGQLVGLINVIGQYRKVALLTNALQIAPSPGLPRFPSET